MSKVEERDSISRNELSDFWHKSVDEKQNMHFYVSSHYHASEDWKAHWGDETEWQLEQLNLLDVILCLQCVLHRICFHQVHFAEKDKFWHKLEDLGY